jgi:hypothetical protein
MAGPEPRGGQPRLPSQQVRRAAWIARRAGRISGGSGNVHLVLPSGPTRYRVNASADSGSSVVNVPTSLASPHTITVTDGSGDITITH